MSAMDVARYVGDPDGPVAEALREYAIKPRARNVSSMDVRRAASAAGADEAYGYSESVAYAAVYVHCCVVKVSCALLVLGGLVLKCCPCFVSHSFDCCEGEPPDGSE